MVLEAVIDWAPAASSRSADMPSAGSSSYLPSAGPHEQTSFAPVTQPNQTTFQLRMVAAYLSDGFTAAKLQWFRFQRQLGLRPSSSSWHTLLRLGVAEGDVAHCRHTLGCMDCADEEAFALCAVAATQGSRPAVALDVRVCVCRETRRSVCVCRETRRSVCARTCVCVGRREGMRRRGGWETRYNPALGVQQVDGSGICSC